MALATAALGVADEVVFVLPREFPHKAYAGATFDERMAMLAEAMGNAPRLSLASSRGGLFAEIAEECAADYGSGVRLSFLCGRDAAERVVNWDYGQPDGFAQLSRGFDLLVAARGGSFEPQSRVTDRVQALEMPEEFDAFSATEIRRRVVAGEPWRHMTPAAIWESVNRIYSR